jgi:quercetin dioxygenase-like cupin family protein
VKIECAIIRPHNAIVERRKAMSVTSGNPKRIVTGQRADGSSVFTRVDEADPLGDAAVDGREVWRMWGSNSLPVRLPNAGQWPQGSEPSADGLAEFLSQLPPATGVRVTLVRYQPGYRDPLYAIDTADVVLVLDGEMTYVLDGGEEMTVHHGDVVVQNGVTKAWENRSDRSAMIAAVVMGAERS